MKNTAANNEVEIDLLHLMKVLWHRAWIIVLSMIVCGAIAFSYAMFMVTPTYESKAKLYVNNGSISLGSSVSLSLNDLNVASKLLPLYVEILKTRETLEEVISTAGLDYTYEQLLGMVQAKSVNSTEIFEVVVTNTDPVEAKLIVDTIVKVIPDRIADIIDGCSVRIVDNAVVASHRSSPSYSKFAMMGVLLGLVASVGVIMIIDLLNNTVHDEDYLSETYGLPILAAIPDMSKCKSSAYKHYGNNAEQTNIHKM
ncbi:MAG: hypothetical protein HFE63_11425 [Clostridiales bacterium]|nr:hypothetical protein [Clostridiales bacterium]